MNNRAFFVRLFIMFSLFAFYSTYAKAQLAVGYHQSRYSFASVSYTINERYVPEFRLGTNVSYDYGFSPEVVFTYKPIIKEDFHFYFGGGVIVNDNFGGVHTPVGIQVYPFDKKNFGFLMELSPVVINFNGDEWVRGSFGITYRFLSQ